MVMSKPSETVWSSSILSDKTTKDVDGRNGGGGEHRHSHLPENNGRNWKLMIDPVIRGKGAEKVVRYGGMLEGPNEVPTLIRDPRFSSVPRTPNIDLKMPKFKFDKWSVGSPPMKSIFIYGLNDNVNQEFLTEQFSSIGEIDQLKVYYHPKTKKHLGIAFVSFSKPSVTKEVQAKFHGTSIMGNIVSVKPDPMCHITKRVLDHLIKGHPVNMPEIIKHVELKYQHKTAAYAFRHNERSQHFYTARGKERKPSDTPSHTPSYNNNKPEKREPPPIEQESTPAAVPKIENVSPQKVDTPPADEISPIRDDEEVLPKVKPPKKRDKTPDLAARTKKSGKKERISPHFDSDPRHDPRLYELEKEHRRKTHSEHAYEEWKMRDELQIRVEKTSRYIREHHDFYDKYPPAPSDALAALVPPDKHRSSSSDKYLDTGYYHSSTAPGYYSSSSGYYDKYYKSSRSGSKERRYFEEKHSSSSSSSSRAKYDKYAERYGKYYRHEPYGSSHDYKKSSSSSELEKLLGKSRDRTTYDLDYHHHHYGSPKGSEPGKSRSRPRDEAFLPERNSKRKRSKSPSYHHSPVLLEGAATVGSTTGAVVAKPTTPKAKESNSESVNSRDTGYHSVSPPAPSPALVPPPPEYDFSTLTENPYGCSRACPRKDVAAIKEIGAKAEDVTENMSSSSMSLDGESDVEMQVEDISPNTTPANSRTQLPVPAVPPPLLPLPLIPPPVLPPPPMVPVQFGSWIHNTYPTAPDVYGSFGAYPDYYSASRTAELLARREAEEAASARRREERRSKERRERTFDMLHHLMESVLSRDLKTRLTEKVAFSRLEQVWNEEEDRKKREEEELAAKRREEMAAQGATDQPTALPDMPSLSEMRNMSDAKQTSHIRQTNLTFKVPKLNRGLRAQVIVKKVHQVQKMDSAGEQSEEEEEADEEDLVKGRKQGNRYQTIYSSSSSSSSESEEEEEEEEVEEEEKKEEVETKVEDGVAARYAPRSEEEELLILESMLGEELTEEDRNYYKQAYDQLLISDEALLDGVTWLSPSDHVIGSTRRRQASADVRHRTGCARTEGYYKMTKQEKIALRTGHNRSLTTEGGGPTGAAPTEPEPAAPVKKVDGKQSARSTRAMQRRQATHYLDVPDLQFQQLSTRRKLVQFQRSDIHDWGLFALEPISADEMVIEYVGQVVREIIANIREIKYEKMGIGSSYLFRIDQSSYIVDATHRGSISRFINHNCDPNCYARVISVGTKKKIVIYSKRDIGAGEEITYDYKFAIEEEANKIPCLCNSALCRGFLN